MAVISIRLNTEEEQMVNMLAVHFEKEKSSLIKYSLKEMYEDLIDRKVIDAFEEEEREGSIKFLTASDILSDL